MIEVNKIYNEDVLELIKRISDNSIDVIPIDPPYLYLKGQRLEREFNEQVFFSECKRILKKDGFIILFGRGESFYRWNTILADLGLDFKEEIIWDKSHVTSPLMNISRIHETISIWTKGRGSIRKSKIPYLEMKSHDIGSIIQDIKRLRSIFTQAKSMNAVLDFLENNFTRTDFKTQPQMANKSDLRNGKCNEGDRCVTVANSMENGLNEKSIIRGYINEVPLKHNANSREGIMERDRCEKVAQSVEFGMNEKSIIKQVRQHYKAIHPTEKPVRLIERLLQLVIIPNSTPKPLAATFFSGSGAHEEACINLGVDFIGCEIDKEYWQLATNRIETIVFNKTQQLFD